MSPLVSLVISPLTDTRHSRYRPLLVCVPYAPRTSFYLDVGVKLLSPEYVNY